MIALADRLGLGGYARRLLYPGERPAAATLFLGLRGRLLQDTAREISTALSAAGVAHCFIRGTALLVQGVYQVGDRAQADVDLYVPAPGTAARRVLERLGFQAAPDGEQSGPGTLRPGIALRRAGARADVEAVELDLHWGVEPVDHLLPRPDRPLPDAAWRTIEIRGGLPVPAPEVHAGLLVHHLVHHDLLHVRGLLDFALLCDAATGFRVDRFEAVTGALGVRRVGRAIAEVARRDLGAAGLADVPPPPRDRRGRCLAALVALERWLAWVAEASPDEHVAITPARVRRRLLLIDRSRDAWPLFADAVSPPRAYLAWRWPDLTPLAARCRHLGRLADKVLTG